MTNGLVAIIVVFLSLVVAGALILVDEWRNRSHRLEAVEEKVSKLEEKVDELSTY